MTIDKIKSLIDPTVYKFWTEYLLREEYETQKAILFKAYKRLKKEIESGILTDIKYHAELQLIIRLGGNMFNETNKI